MKVLLLTQYAPYPPDSGIKVKIHNLMRCLGSFCDLACIYLVEDDRSVAGTDAILEGGKEYVVRIAPEGNPLKRYLYHMTQLAGLTSRGAVEIGRIIEKESPQMLWLEFGYIGNFIPWLRRYGVPIVYGTHNSQFALDFQRWRYERNPLKLLKAAPLLPIRYYHERRFMPMADCLCCISREDMAYYGRITAPERVAYMPFVYDHAGVMEVLAAETDHPYVCMIGSLRSVQNYVAAVYILEGLWPEIAARRPDLHLYLIGQLPEQGSAEHRRIAELSGNRERVAMLGRVDSVIPFVKGALVNLVPMTVGSGVRTKIIESAACGTPVVSTSIGAEGLPFADGTSIFIADRKEEFVEKVVALVEDEDKRRAIAGEAFRVFTMELSLEAGRRALQRIFREMADRGCFAAKGGYDG